MVARRLCKHTMHQIKIDNSTMLAAHLLSVQFPSTIQTMVDQCRAQGCMQPFLKHPVALLSVYELGPSSEHIPRYVVPQGWHKESILRLLHAIARRVYNVESTVKTVRRIGNRGAIPRSSGA